MTFERRPFHPRLERVYDVLAEALGEERALQVMNDALAEVGGPPLNNDKFRRIAATLIRHGGYIASVGNAFSRTIT